jgi:hypothetical protein
VTTSKSIRKRASGGLLEFMSIAFSLVLLVSIGKSVFFGGSHLSRIVAISTYVITVATSWVSLRVEKKETYKNASESNNLTELVLSLFFPVIAWVMLFALAMNVLSFAKNMFSLFLLLRRTEREVSRQTAIPKRSKSQKRTSMGNLRIGDRVRFDPPDHDPIEGVVARFNKKTVKVINKPGEYWNVPHGLLTKLKTTEKTRQKKHSLQLIKG